MAPVVRSAFLPALVAWLSWCSPCGGTHSGGLGECPALSYEPQELPLRDMGGLTALVNSAESTRNAIVEEDLPYTFIGTQAREA